tara:strand:+ start:2084 stop:3283 length:1200 start_codon:yes stop_codon:yes gene_type:complete
MYTDFTREFLPRATKLVQRPSDLAPPLSSEICYEIDGVVDMLLTSIVVPAGGLTIRGCGIGVSKLMSSSDNATLFVDDGFFSGALFLSMVTLTSPGLSSKIFDLDNAGNGNAVELSQVNIEGSTSLGSLANYRQFLGINVAIVAPDDGLEFIGTWTGGLAIVDTILIAIPSGVTVFKAGLNFLVVGSLRSNLNALSIDTTSVVFDFAEANFTADEGFSLTNYRANLNSNSIPNIPATSTKAHFRDCSGISNTYVGGELAISTEVETPIATADTLVKLLGTTTYNHLAWFSGLNSNEFVSETDSQLDLNISGVLSFSGNSNTVMILQVRRWDASASVYADVGSEFEATLNAGGRGEGISFQAIATVDKGDRIEVWIKNMTNNSNITAQIGGSLLLSVRGS